jgi:hypothetical protein
MKTIHVSPDTALTLLILGVCGVMMWVLLSMSGYARDVLPRVARQPLASPSVVVAVPMPKPSS